MPIYTESEVVAQFRQAANKKQQVTILAELQGWSKDKVLDVIEEAGEDVSGYRSVGKRIEIAAEVKEGRFTAGEDELLRERISAGASYAEVAEELGRSYNSVFRRAERLGFDVTGTTENADTPAEVPGKGKYRKWTEADVEALIEMREDGLNSREIAAKIGCSRQSVDNHIVQLKKEGRIPDEYKPRTVKKPAETYGALIKVIRELPGEGAERVYRDVMSILTGDAEVGYFGEGSLPARIADNEGALHELEKRLEAFAEEQNEREAVVAEDESSEREEVFSFPVEGGAPCDPARWGFERRWNLALMLADMMGGDPREVRISSRGMLVEFGDVVFDVRFIGDAIPAKKGGLL